MQQLKYGLANNVSGQYRGETSPHSLLLFTVTLAWLVASVSPFDRF